MNAETPDLLSYWYRALEQEFGIALEVENRAVITELYRLRKEHGDPRLDALSIAQMQDGTWWIVKKEMRLED